MSSATVSGGVAGEGAGGAAEVVVECDCGGERCEACGEADAEVLKGAGAVSLEREDVLAGPEDTLDALTYWREVRLAPRLVFAARTHDPRVEVGEFGLEVLATEVLIADQDQHLAGLTLASLDELQAYELLVDLWRGQRERPWGAIQSAKSVKAKAPEVAAVAGAIPVVGGVGERVTEARMPAPLDGLAAAGALHRCGVDQQQIVIETGAVLRELADQRLDRPRQTQPALVVGGPLRQVGKQVTKLTASGPEEPCVGGHPHHRLRDTQSDDLRIRDPPSGVSCPPRQEIVHRAVNSDKQQIEVGVHRGPLRVGAGYVSTADFDLPAYNPSPRPTTTPPAVALLI